MSFLFILLNKLMVVNGKFYNCNYLIKNLNLIKNTLSNIMENNNLKKHHIKD